MGSLRTIRSREGAFQRDRVRGVSRLSVCAMATFQRDMVRGVSGLSVRTRAPYKRTKCVKSQDFPFARGHFPKGHDAVCLRSIRSRKSSFEKDAVRGLSVSTVVDRAPFCLICAPMRFGLFMNLICGNVCYDKWFPCIVGCLATCEIGFTSR